MLLNPAPTIISAMQTITANASIPKNTEEMIIPALDRESDLALPVFLLSLCATILKISPTSVQKKDNINPAMHIEEYESTTGRGAEFCA